VAQISFPKSFGRQQEASSRVCLVDVEFLGRAPNQVLRG
jgi:hypothetical protein